MGLVKQVQSVSEFHREIAVVDKLVLVDFFATWCGPCRQIAPVLEELSVLYNHVVFLKVDVDQLGELAEQYQIQAMPTFVFLKNKQRLDTLRGGDRAALESKIKSLAGSPIESGEGMPSVGVKGYIDMTGLIDKHGCECLNEADDHTLEHALNPSGGYLASDTDEQLIIFLTFTQVVKLHSIRMMAPVELGPKTVKLFINQTSTPDFDACEGSAGVQELEITPEDLREGAVINLKFVKFQNVNNLTIFVKDNQSGGEVTRIDHLALIGIPVNTTNMGEFKRVAGKKGEVHG